LSAKLPSKLTKIGQLARHAASQARELVASPPPRVRAVAAAVLFLMVWAGLNALFNMRYPARPLEAGYYFLLPSVDVCLLLLVYSLLGWRGRQPLWGATLAVAVFIMLVRLFRIADGLIHMNYFRDLKLYVDLSLLPDLWRLFYMSMPLPKLVGWTVLALVGVSMVIAITYAALVHQQRYLARGRRERLVFASVVALAGVLSPLWPAKGENQEVRHGLFTRSVAPIGVEQVRFAASMARFRRKKALEIRLAQEQIMGTPADLLRLKGADVLLFVVESYGSSVFRQQNASGCPNFEGFTTSLGSKGYLAASKLLNSSTYGGGSWFAHATYRTGVPIRDSLEYAVIYHRKPPAMTMAKVFRQAGYRTVLAHPGTTRPFPEGLVHGFDRRYYSFHLDYEGPTFGFATMPDQYTIHAVHNKEMESARQPLFVEYGLVSSHAPWTPVPTVVEDWSKLERGRIFNTSPGVRFPVSWTDMEHGAVAFAHSLCYDFDVMRRYIAERIKRNSFIVILGDHQPPGAITYDDPSWAVPLHVISQDKALIDRFVEAGYTPGMVPRSGGSIKGLQTMLVDLMTLLSKDGPSTAFHLPR
jgi:hypothetical protein